MTNHPDESLKIATKPDKSPVGGYTKKKKKKEGIKMKVKVGVVFAKVLLVDETESFAIGNVMFNHNGPVSRELILGKVNCIADKEYRAVSVLAKWRKNETVELGEIMDVPRIIDITCHEEFFGKHVDTIKREG